MSSSDAPPRPSQTSGDSTVAALLTWVLPGAGHLYLGRHAAALVGFAIVAGAYLLGLELSDGMGFEFLHEELRGRFAPALAPELGFVGGLVWQMRAFGFGPGYPRPFPDLVFLGTTLTAAAGVLNCCLAAQAHHDARRPKGAPYSLRSPGVLCAFAWLVPGLGHLMQKRVLRGALVFACVVGLLVLGTALADGANLSRERHFYYWGGQFLAGLPAMALDAGFGHAPVTGDIPYAEGGLVIAAIGGLLNVLALLDVYHVAEVRSGVVAPVPSSREDRRDARGKSAKGGADVESLRLRPDEEEVSA